MYLKKKKTKAHISYFEIAGGGWFEMFIRCWLSQQRNAFQRSQNLITEIFLKTFAIVMLTLVAFK